MKKIIALALALIMALSMASVAFAAPTTATLTFNGTDANGESVNYSYANADVKPGEVLALQATTWAGAAKPLNGCKVTGIDFTTGDLCGASLVESVKINKTKDAIELTIKESYTMDTAKEVQGIVKFKNAAGDALKIYVDLTVNNNVNDTLVGVKKVGDVVDNSIVAADNTVQIIDEDGGYVSFTEGELTGVVKMEKEEKVYFNLTEGADEDTTDAIVEYLGEDYEAIVEYYQFETRAFKNDVAFSYDAYAEDPHFFYVWDGEKLVDLEAKYDDDEDVEAYVFTAKAEGTIVVTDVEVVAAAEEETKNPDTGANDVVGVAAALAVVSLVAAGAVSLKK